MSTQHREPSEGGVHGFLEAMYGRLFRLIATLGLPPALFVVLEPRGRRSGETRSTVLVTGSHEGQRYLVSLVGPRCDWVKNAGAAGGEAVIRHGRRRRVMLEEVPAEKRAP